jgi:hypothetical protein
MDEEAELARQCGGDGCSGQWAAHGQTVDFCQVEVSGFLPPIAEHVALHDPDRVLRRSQPNAGSWPATRSAPPLVIPSCHGTTATTANTTGMTGLAPIYWTWRCPMPNILTIAMSGYPSA